MTTVVVVYKENVTALNITAARSNTGRWIGVASHIKTIQKSNFNAPNQ